MFRFGDYTLPEVAELFDCSGEGLAESFQAFSRRQYWLFGPLLFDKRIVDEMAPSIRAMMQRMGTTRADMAARKQKQQQMLQDIEQHKENIAEIERQSQRQREEFSRQMEELLRRSQKLGR